MGACEEWRSATQTHWLGQIEMLGEKAVEPRTKWSLPLSFTMIRLWQSAPHYSQAHYPAWAQTQIINLTQEVTKHWAALLGPGARIRKPRKCEVYSSSRSLFTSQARETMLIQLFNDKEVVWEQKNVLLRARICAESKFWCSWDKCKQMWEKNTHVSSWLETLGRLFVAHWYRSLSVWPLENKKKVSSHTG